MRPSFRLDSFDRLAAASRGGDRDAMSRLHAAIRPMAIRRCRAELDPPAVADSVADGACLSVLHMLADRPAAGEPFLHLLNTMTRGDDHPNRRCLLRPPCSTSRGLEVLCARERDALILRLFVGLGVDRTSGRTTERRQLEAGVFALAAFGSIATASVVTLLALIAVLVLI